MVEVEQGKKTVQQAEKQTEKVKEEAKEKTNS
jgi:hypothetical protein